MSGTDPIVFHIKFNGKIVTVDSLQPNATIGDLKNALFELTQVLPETQKILGLRASNNDPLTDSVELASLVLKSTTKLMLIGSTEEAIRDISKVVETAPSVVDDFDFREEDIDLSFLPENVEKVQRRSKAYRPRKLCEPRVDKRLLVLDIDYTIFDHLSPAESVQQLARPYLHEFLRRAYVHYDIAIWSATSMTWILAKLSQLGVIPSNSSAILRSQSTDVARANAESGNSISTDFRQQQSNPPFQVTLLLDSTDMISVHFLRHGVKEVKPLAVLWNNHPEWGPHNTIMFDDIKRNFVMNAQSGLRINPYRDAHVNCKKDHELRRLARYLELIATNETDFRNLNHNRWERYVEHSKRGRDRPTGGLPTSNLQPAAATSVTSLSFLQDGRDSESGVAAVASANELTADEENGSQSVADLNAANVFSDEDSA